jgi:PAS domain S-box-containing protein
MVYLRIEMKKPTPKKQDLIKSVVDNLPGLVFRVVNDGEWTFRFASHGALAILGYAPQELVSATAFRNMIPKKDQQANKRVLRQISEEKPYYEVVYRIRTAPGKIKWVKEQGTGVYSETGELVALDGFLVDITDQKTAEIELREENLRLKSSIRNRHGLDKLIGKSMVMKEVYDLIIKAAATRTTIVITGESGTGKELAARAIHKLSNRSKMPFVVVNCSAIPENLLESEFFGYRKGAFSGALTDRKGLLDAARGGTLFLDEVGEIPLHMQAKLLRALDGNGFTPVGDTDVRSSEFRLIAATNQDLDELVGTGQMREDFYYRINAVSLRMPPLRERRDDILMLADYFLNKFSDLGVNPSLPENAKSTLINYSWPGNVRELQNVISRFLTINKIELASKTVSPKKAKKDTQVELAGDIEKMEKQAILAALKQNHWHIGKSAADLGFSRRTMQRRMIKYNLR